MKRIMFVLMLMLFAFGALCGQSSAEVTHFRCQEHLSDCDGSGGCGPMVYKRHHTTDIYADLDKGTFALSDGGKGFSGNRSGNDAWEFHADNSGSVAHWTTTYTFSPSGLTLTEQVDLIAFGISEYVTTYVGNCEKSGT